MDDNPKVESGIPIPIRKRSLSTTYRKTLEAMGIGDSFFQPNSNPRKVRHAFLYMTKKLGIKIAVRSVEGGVRVWRVE
jgi:hypothetical protein